MKLEWFRCQLCLGYCQYLSKDIPKYCHACSMFKRGLYTEEERINCLTLAGLFYNTLDVEAIKKAEMGFK